MSAFIGRDLAFTWKGSSVAGIQAKKIKWNDQVIDITSGEDAGKRVLLTLSGQDEVDITISGVTKSKVIRDHYNAGGASRQGTCVITWPDGSTLSGTFQLSNYNEDAKFKEATVFEVTLLSASTDLAYTPGA